MSDTKDHNSDSDDAPEEFTQEQAKLEDEALRKIQRDNKARVAREKKEKRRIKAASITSRKKSKKIETFEEEAKEEEDTESLAKKGFLSKNIIYFLAEREKQENELDSEEEGEGKVENPRKKKLESSGIETVIYKEIPPPECLKTGLDFLNKRKALVPRSSSVIRNSGQALRLVTRAGLSKKQG